MLLLDGQVHHDTHAIPMGNYVIEVGNYVIATPSQLGNYMSVDSLLPDFTAALLAAVIRYGPPHAVVAHSMGAAAAALAVLDGRLSARRLVLLAPADPLAAADALARRAGAGSRVRARMLRRLAARAGGAPADFSLARRAAEHDDLLPELLVIHDETDRQVPFASAARLACAWPGRLHRTAGLGHQAILRDQAVIGVAARFVTGAALSG